MIFDFVKLISFLKMHLGGNLAPSNLAAGAFLIPLTSKAGREDCLSFDLVHSTYEKNGPTLTIPKFVQGLVPFFSFKRK
jgi:hypothetical protein